MDNTEVDFPRGCVDRVPVDNQVKGSLISFSQTF